MKYQISIFALLLVALSPVSAQMVASHTTAPGSAFEQAGAQAVGKPVARVNGAVLTDRELLREMAAIFPYARQHNGGVPKAMEAEIRTGAMKMIIFEELVYQEAVRRKMTVPPAKMERAMAAFRKQFKSQDDYKEFMQIEVNNSQQLLRAKVRRSLLIEALLKQEVNDKSVVSLLQAKVYYDKNPDQFRIPESYAVQTISIVPPQKATPDQLKEARKRADDALRQAKSTKSYDEFGTLAEKISEDDWHVMMGDHKAVDGAKLPPAVLRAVQAMQPGQISDLIQVEQIYTVVRLNAHVPSGMQKFEEVKASLRKSLQKSKGEQLRADLGKKLRADAKIEEL
jgi:hypothetical protein